MFTEGYDFDGVIAEGNTDPMESSYKLEWRPPADSVIVMARPLEDAPKVLEFLHGHEILNPVFFVWGAELALLQKAAIIQALGLSRYVEGDADNARSLQKMCPNCRVEYGHVEAGVLWLTPVELMDTLMGEVSKDGFHPETT